MSGLSHTARHAAGVENIPASQHATYLKARSAQYKPERSSSESQLYWSAPLRRWLKVYASGPGVLTIEHHHSCPCSLVG